MLEERIISLIPSESLKKYMFYKIDDFKRENCDKLIQYFKEHYE